MTELQFKKFKKKQIRDRFSDTRRIEEVFPNIDKMEISYQLHHSSALGSQNKESSWIVNLQSQIDFVIECLNRECSSAGFDLKSQIYDMYREHQTDRTGEMRCNGQEAPDHPEQNCDSELKYTIKISYK